MVNKFDNMKKVIWLLIFSGIMASTAAVAAGPPKEMGGWEPGSPYNKLYKAAELDSFKAEVVKVMDIKTPGSGEQNRNRLQNIEHLRVQDQVKFVICNEYDYRWSRQFIADHQLNERCEVLFSPSYQQLDARDLADWILQDALPVRMQMQLHKLLWGDQPGK